MERRLNLEAGVHDREFCPVNFELSEEVESAKLVEESSGREIPVQLEKDSGITRIYWIVERLKAGEEKSYKLETTKSPASKEEKEVVSLEETSDDKIEVRIKGQFFTAYHFGRQVARPFLYPLIGPGGKHITRRLAGKEDKDLDHHHHRSFWVAHGDVNGIDNWSEKEGHARTVHDSFEALQEGNVFARIRAKGFWESPEGRRVLEELRDIKVYNLPPSLRIVDINLLFKPVEGKVKFGDTKEGGIVALRVAPSMEVRNGGRIENSFGGLNQPETWGKRAHWCDYSGEVEGETVGAAIFDAQDNFRHPTWWHVRDYGLMAANPFALSFYKKGSGIRGDYILKEKDSLKFCFRLYLHQGDAKAGRVKDKYIDYVNPPFIKAN